MTTLTATGALVRFVLRRDRVRLAVWVLGISVVVVISAGSLPGVYPDQAAIDSYVRLFGDNPALVTFAGPGYGFDDPSIGVILVNETQLWAMLGTALMSIFLVNRHTRAEEESERAELLRSGVVGRHAPAAAATAVVAGANLAVGLLCLLGFIANDYPFAGSVALAGSIAAGGLVFVGVAVVAAQLFGTGRATLGWSSGALVVAFVVRALGDIGGNVLTWLSPLGWAQAVRAFADERWWTLALCAVVSVGLVGLSFALATRRDLGAGMIAARPGPAGATGWVRSPLGLAFRLQRSALAGWALALVVTGVVYGSIGNDVDALVEDNPQLEDVFAALGEGGITDSYLAYASRTLALMAGGFAVSAVLALRSEEQAGRADSVLAGPVDRRRWAAGNLVVSAAGSVLAVVLAGLGAGLAYAVVTGDGSQVLRLAGSALADTPGTLVLAGFALAVVGLVPRFAAAAWGLLAVVAVVEFFGELLRLPGWALDLSPFAHLPAVPAEDLSVLPLVVLTALAAALAAAGLLGIRHRDIATH